MKIIYSSKFAREYKKIPKNIKLKAEKKKMIFRKNIFDKSLKTHKLSGKLKDFWSFSVDDSYRIIFEIADKNSIYFHSIKDYSVYL